jgi:hypothetical protein
MVCFGLFALAGESPMKLSYIGLAILVLVLGEAALLANNRTQEDGWAEYRDSHNCKPVGNIEVSNRAGYLCDDGQVHYRWRQMR